MSGILVRRTACASIALAIVVAAGAQAPAVVRLEPANGSTDTAPGTGTLRVVFDRDMDQNAGYTMMTHGAGLAFPRLGGQPHWADARTFEVPVLFEAGVDYGCVLNADGSSQRFRDTAGHVLPAVEWRFSVASALPGEPADAAAMRAWNEHAFAELQRAVCERYAYRDRTGTKWAEVFAQAHDELLAAPSRREFVRRAAKLLAPAQDPHLWFKFGEQVVGTHRRSALPNWNPSLLPKLLHELQQKNRNCVSGRTDDGIGYVAIATFAREQRDDVLAVQAALAELRDCKALVLDVRANGGGDEHLARQIAAWFVDGEVTYAAHRSVDPSADGGFAPVQRRTLAGNPDAEHRFAGPVAVLTGQVNLSSCEAFLLMMKQCTRAVLVGARSSGSSGNPQPFALGPGVVVMVPSWQALRPDGTCFEGEGIAPDVEVATTPAELRTSDPVLAKALALLRAKLAAR